MSFFQKWFGKKTKQPTKSSAYQVSITAASHIPDSTPIEEPGEPIRVFDPYGRELFVPRADYRKNVLPSFLKNAWDNPDQLYNTIVMTLKDGFRADVVLAAEHLYRKFPSTKSTCLWGVILKDSKRLDEAEKVFKDYMAKSGEDGYILNNLAKVYADRKDDAKAEATLWHALEVDPNQENAVGWFQSLQRERGGIEAEIQGLRRIAALPNSWRAQLWLARAALDNKDLPQALACYQESIAHAPKPIPADMLMQISGDLGKNGHVREALEVAEPLFDLQAHGLQVGNNLIKAHLDLGQIETARNILTRLYSLKRPDWQKTLAFWDTEISKARIQSQELAPNTPPKITMALTDGPIWIGKNSPVAKLFPLKAEDSPLIAFLGSSAATGNQSKVIKRQMSDASGRASRFVPLFLAEQVQYNTSARTTTLTPWIIEPSVGFVLSGVPWADDDAAAHARQIAPPADYVVVTHIISADESWQLSLRLIRTIDSQCIGNFNLAMHPSSPQDGLLKLSTLLLSSLMEHDIAQSNPLPPLYQVPQSAELPWYLLRLEQLLAVRFEGLETGNRRFLSGIREIIDGNIHLCLQCPKNPTTRFILIQTLRSMKLTHPEIIAEYRDKIQLLQKQYPLPPAEDEVVQQILQDVFSD